MNDGQDCHDPDASLVAGIAAGDQRALAEIVRRHGGRLRALVTRFAGSRGDADDILQEAFVLVWRKAALWQPGNVPFAAYLTRIVVNRAIDFDRRRRVRRFFGLESAAEIADPEAGAETVAAERSELRSVMTDVARLPGRQRAAILLAATGSETNGTIAAALGISEGAAEQLLVRARRALREARTARTESGR